MRGQEMREGLSGQAEGPVYLDAEAFAPPFPMRLPTAARASRVATTSFLAARGRSRGPLSRTHSGRGACARSQEKRRERRAGRFSLLHPISNQLCARRGPGSDPAPGPATMQYRYLGFFPLSRILVLASTRDGSNDQPLPCAATLPPPPPPPPKGWSMYICSRSPSDSGCSPKSRPSRRVTT
ncbi:hypothetical protein LX36DRAFT_435298 [Colletotrichum falcatum]|nr:hypothetical protein LX36DRAFT_435298 [Colletotrichum falcatum]